MSATRGAWRRAWPHVKKQLTTNAAVLNSYSREAANFYPDIDGDDRLCYQFASLPRRADADEY